MAHLVAHLVVHHKRMSTFRVVQEEANGLSVNIEMVSTNYDHVVYVTIYLRKGVSTIDKAS
jgi:hypothetical protein